MAPTALRSEKPPFLAPHHVVYLALVLAPITLFTTLSIFSQSHAYNVYTTAAPGSLLEASGRAKNLQPPTSSFAQKSNIINVHFIKYAWLWTTIAWLAQLWTLRSPPPVDIKGKGKAKDDDEPDATPGDQDGTIASPLAKSLLRYIIATICWILFAMWLFGPSLMERILTSSGGVCLPHESVARMGLSHEAAFQMPALEIDEAFCRAGRKGISVEERPELFKTAHRIVTDAVGGGRLRGRWKGGHDVSGHVFILSLSTLFLLEELSPYLPLFISTYLPANISQAFNKHLFPFRRNIRNPFQGPQRGVNAGVTAGILSLLVLWIFSLINTSLFFHTPQEKFSGLLLGIGSWAVLPKGG